MAPVFGQASTVSATASPAVYDCTFTNRWSAAAHPNDYPSNAHWSPPVLVAASEPDFLWAEGEVASPGMKVLAETGAPGLVQSEITAKTGYGHHEVGKAMFNSREQTQEINGLRVDGTNKYISYATMVAPSPDWITGFYNVVPISGDGFWYEDFTVISQPYDAGTDSGTTYTAADQATTPSQPIREIKGSVLQTGRVNPMAQMKCTRQKNEDQDDDFDSTPAQFGVVSTVSATASPAVYDCWFSNRWNIRLHPTEYPRNAHWSPPVLVAASEPDFLWADGKVASPGMKVLAETGNPSLVQSEITAKTGYGHHEVGKVQFNSEKYTQQIKSLRVDADNKYISYASMVAPSPDWITGFYNVVPISEDGFWYDAFTVASQPYDAGTDSGTTYKAADQATTPAQPIREITDLTSVLSYKGRIFPMAKMTCARQLNADDGMDSSEDNGMDSSEDNGMDSSEDNGMDSSEDNGMDSSEDNGMDSSEDNGMDSSEDDDVDSSPALFGAASTVSATASPAVYDCTFTNRWSAAAHPNDYPSNAHWSPPVLVAASEPDFLWAEDKVASPGMKLLAETGAPRLVQSEITAKTGYGHHEVGRATFNSREQTQEINGLRVDGTNKYISYATMVAPSPDWITGFYNVVPISRDGFWYEDFTVISQPYDAGTDSGTTYTSADRATRPAQTIKEITALASVLASDRMIRPVAQMTCTRQGTRETDAECKDKDGWHAFQGEQFDCGWFGAEVDRCTRYGTVTDEQFKKGTRVTEACCACIPK